MENSTKLSSPSSSSSTTSSSSSSSSPSLYARFHAAFFARPLVSIALLYLTINVALAAYRARGDLPALGFVLFSYLDLLLLFFFLIRFERQLHGAAGVSRGQRAQVKVAVWLLSAALMLGFCWRIGQAFPWPVKAVIWTLAGSVAGGGFYGLFLCKEIEVG